MTTAHRLFSEADSAKFAGVSLDTIKQYERFGLIQGVRKGDQTFYREIELRGVFSVVDSPKGASDTSAPDQRFAEQIKTTNQGGETPYSDLNHNIKSTSQSNHERKGEPEPQTPNNSSTSQTERTTPEYHTARFADDKDSTFTAVKSEPVQQISFHPDSSPGMFEIFEMNKTLREQIQMLKDERDWLRRRVEKLESRTERDQMLLVSEHETVKTLMHQLPAPKRSFWQLALPWLNK